MYALLHYDASKNFEKCFFLLILGFAKERNLEKQNENQYDPVS